MKIISPDIKLKIINLASCFWYWNSFYIFYAAAIGTSARKLERKYQKEGMNKYKITEFILDDLKNDSEAMKSIMSAFYNLEKPYEKENNPKYREALISLKEFKDAVGTDIIDDEIKQKEIKEKVEKDRITNDLVIEKSNKIEEIKKEFYKKSALHKQKDKQKRGFWLEKVFYELLKLDDIHCTPPYKTIGEQIDGHLKFESFDYLVEIKWTDERVKQKDVSVLDGKIKNKAQSNRGLILSINGFDKSAIDAAKLDRNLIFMDAQDLVSVLERQVTFFDFLSTKEDQLVRFGLAYKK